MKKNLAVMKMQNKENRKFKKMFMLKINKKGIFLL